MAIVQDTYSNAPPIGYAGMVANGETHNTISRTVEDAAGIAFGRPVFRGAGDRGCTATVGTAATFLGFIEADHGMVVLPGGTADVVPQHREAAIRTLGAIYVVAGEAVTDGAPVYVAAANGAIVDTSTSNILTPFVFDDTAASGAIVRIVRR